MHINIDFFNSHLDSHPSKILDWLYLGGYNNALNKQVFYLEIFFIILINFLKF